MNNKIYIYCMKPETVDFYFNCTILMELFEQVIDARRIMKILLQCELIVVWLRGAIRLCDGDGSDAGGNVVCL